jgi:uncharacterized membrane protein
MIPWIGLQTIENPMDFILRIFHDLTQVYPSHLMAVHFPIALTGAALLFILLALWRHSESLERAAVANLALAAAGTIVSAALGIHDNLDSFSGNAPHHDAKIILACILFIVTTVTALVRWRRKTLFQDKAARIIYVAAYFISFGLSAVLGFLGSVIIYGF